MTGNVITRPVPALSSRPEPEPGGMARFAGAQLLVMPLRAAEEYVLVVVGDPPARRAAGVQDDHPAVPALQRDKASHEGYEWLYVLNGTALLLLGDREFVLTPGEAAEFDTRLPHGLGNAGSSPTELLKGSDGFGQESNSRGSGSLQAPGGVDRVVR